MSNSETVQLTWRVTLPGQMPINITYDNTSSLDTVDYLGMNITSTLTEYISDEYIESTLVITVLRGVDINGTELECLYNELDASTARVYVNISGI